MCVCRDFQSEIRDVKETRVKLLDQYHRLINAAAMLHPYVQLFESPLAAAAAAISCLEKEVFTDGGAAESKGADGGAAESKGADGGVAETKGTDGGAAVVSVETVTAPGIPPAELIVAEDVQSRDGVPAPSV